MAEVNQIFCAYRRKWVKRTPEEEVRQQFLTYLLSQCAYPASRIAVEVAIEGKRVDAIVYTMDMQPWMLLEFKAPHVTMGQSTLDQIAVYNRQLHAPYLVLSNGQSTLCARVTDQVVTFLPSLPSFPLS